MLDRYKHILFEKTSIAPLIVFRISFGLIMAFSILRFWYRGWIHELYIAPSFYFPFEGLEWIRPLGETGMYAVFVLLLLCSLFIALGFYYRWSVAVFTILFSYVELIDKTNYLNHYYLVSLVGFLLFFLPAAGRLSLDSVRLGVKSMQVSRWCIEILKFQLGIVYFFSGLAKINADWIIHAQPLKTWLPSLAHLPLIGGILELEISAYLFSWFGLLFDLSIVFFLIMNRTRLWAYLLIVTFHLMTGLFFQIGMFPVMMIVLTLVFFPAAKHDRVLSFMERKVRIIGPDTGRPYAAASSRRMNMIASLVGLYVIVQMMIPLRNGISNSQMFWTEEGYRFSWRVMLMEKTGYAAFELSDPKNGRKWQVPNYDYLTPNQEKMMSTQADMILQYAHFLKENHEDKGFEGLEIRAISFVTLNGRKSQEYVDSRIDLGKVDSTAPKSEWLRPYNEELWR